MCQALMDKVTMSRLARPSRAYNQAFSHRGRGKFEADIHANMIPA